MLSKNDLQKIKKVVQEVAVTKEETKNFTTKDDLKHFATKDDLEKQLKPVKSDIRKINKNVSLILKHFDRGYTDLKKRVKRVEDNIGLSPFPLVP